MSEILLIALFATIAALVGLRLYMVLGRRAEDEPIPRPAPSSDVRPDFAQPEEEEIHFTGPGSAAMEAMHAADGQFDPRSFLDGAREAYRIIGRSFADGDRDSLRELLSDPVFARWADAIGAREAEGRTQAFDLVSIEQARVDDAEFDGRLAQISVEFDADIISCVKDKDGTVIDGDPDLPRRVREIWTFQRPIDSPSPIWILTKVQAG